MDPIVSDEVVWEGDDEKPSFSLTQQELKTVDLEKVKSTSEALDIEVHVVQMGMSRMKMIRELLADSESMLARYVVKAFDMFENVNQPYNRRSQVEWTMPDITILFE